MEGVIIKGIGTEAGAGVRAGRGGAGQGGCDTAAKYRCVGRRKKWYLDGNRVG